jgi:hypothetical protein
MLVRAFFGWAFDAGPSGGAELMAVSSGCGIADEARACLLSNSGFGGYVRAAGNWQLHRFRQTCTTNWLRAGMPIDKLSRFLGHANIRKPVTI